MSQARDEGGEEGDIVSEWARQVVHEVLVAATDARLLPERAGLFPHQLMALGRELAPALGAALSDPDLRRRIVAAWILTKLAELVVPSVVPRKDSLERASRVLLEALAQEAGEPLILACVFLAGGAVPSKAIPRLSVLAQREDRTIAVYSAAALSWTGESVAAVIPVLTGAMHQDDPQLGQVAARALARLAVRGEEAVTTLIRLLGTVPATQQYSVLLALRDAGPTASSAAGQLQAIVSDASVSGLIRSAAAEAFGSVSGGDREGRKFLLRLLQESDWQVVAR
jgi:hypothetical protein